MYKKLAAVLLSVLFTIYASHPVLAEGRTVALFPLRIISSKPVPYLETGVKTMLRSRLAEVGLRVVTRDTFQGLLKDNEKKGEITKERVEEIARKVHAQYGIFGSLTAIGKGLSLDLSLLDLTKSPPKLIHVSQASTEDEFIPRLAEVAKRFREAIEGRYPPPRIASRAPERREEEEASAFYSLGTPQQPPRETVGGIFREVSPRTRRYEPMNRFSLRMEVMSMDVGDLDGDGKAEVALLSRHELRIYKKEGKTFRLIKKMQGPKGTDWIKVSMGDADGNGRPEIYIAGYKLSGVETTVYEWNNGNLRKLFTRSGHLAVVRRPGSKVPYLLYQDSHPTQLFSGHIYEMAYEGGRLVKKIRFPRILHTRFYTMTPYDIDKNGSPELIGLGDGDDLHIWDLNGAVLWHEDETIGGTNNAIELQEKSSDPNMPRVPFESRLVLADLNGDGRKDLVAVKNTALVSEFEHFLLYDSSYLLGYKFKGASLERAWTTRKMPYCTVDMQVFNNTLFVALQKLKMKNWSKGLSRIVWFDLPKKQ